MSGDQLRYADTQTLYGMLWLDTALDTFRIHLWHSDFFGDPIPQVTDAIGGYGNFTEIDYLQLFRKVSRAVMLTAFQILPSR
jgi:hypothetical protein